MNSRIFILLFTAILLAFSAAAANIQINPAAQQVSGTPASTVTGSFVVTALANFTNLEVKSTNTNISFSPSLFSLNANNTQTVNFAITVAAQTAPAQYTIPFTVGNAVETASGTVTLTVAQVPSLALTDLFISKSNKNGTISITNNGNVELTNIALSINANPLKDNKNRQITLNVYGDNNLVLIENNQLKNTIPLIKAGESKTIIVKSTFPTQLNLGDYITTLTASAGTLNATSQITLTNSYCKYGRAGVDIEIDRLRDISSDDEWVWRPLDEVKVEIKIRNSGDDDQDIEVDWDLYDPDTQQFIELDDNSKTISVDSGKTKTDNFIIDVPSDIEDKDYRLYVKAFIEGDEDEQCTDLINSDQYQTVRVKKKSRDVRIDSINIIDQLTCGTSFDVTAKLTNIGRNDEDRVKLVLINQELKINLESSSSSLDQGDGRTVQFTAQIPQDAAAKIYELNLVAYFDYDEDSNTYEQRSDVVKKEITVENCQPIETKKSVAISAELLSGVVAGKQLGIKVTLKNTGENQTTYNVGVSGIDEWATLDKIDPQSITLDKGESKDVLVYLNIKPEASGEKEFTLRSVYSGKQTEQKVALTIEGSNANISKISQAFKDNWFIWLIVLVNIVLIILIIIAARRLTK